jgi:hypothetical protein
MNEEPADRRQPQELGLVDEGDHQAVGEKDWWLPVYEESGGDYTKEVAVSYWERQWFHHVLIPVCENDIM